MHDGCRAVSGSKAMAEALKKRAKGAPVPPEKWLPVLTTYADQCFQSGQQAFPLGKYKTMKYCNAADGKSLVALAPLLEAMFIAAPNGVVNHVAFKGALVQLKEMRPQVFTGEQTVDKWSDCMSTALRVAIAHCRLMVQIPARFEQRTRGLTPSEKQRLKEVLAHYHPELSRGQTTSLESLETDIVPPKRQLRVVRTDELDFSAGSPDKSSGPASSATTPMAIASSSGQGMARWLVEALSASPVSAKRKMPVKKKPASAHCKGSKKTRVQVAKTKVEEAEDEEEEAEAEVEEEDVEEGPQEEEELECDVEEEAEEEPEASANEEAEEEAEPEKEREEAVPQVHKKPAIDDGSGHKKLYITNASGRTYIQEKLANGKLRLMVQVTEAQARDHQHVIKTIARAIQAENLDRDGALRLRDSIVGGRSQR